MPSHTIRTTPKNVYSNKNMHPKSESAKLIFTEPLFYHPTIKLARRQKIDQILVWWCMFLSISFQRSCFCLQISSWRELIFHATTFFNSFSLTDLKAFNSSLLSTGKFWCRRKKSNVWKICWRGFLFIGTLRKIAESLFIVYGRFILMQT